MLLVILNVMRRTVTLVLSAGHVRYRGATKEECKMKKTLFRWRQRFNCIGFGAGELIWQDYILIGFTAAVFITDALLAAS